jgi:hypothetical protein
MKLEIQKIDFHEWQSKKNKGEVRSVGILGHLTKEGDRTRDETSHHRPQKSGGTDACLLSDDPSNFKMGVE